MARGSDTVADEAGSCRLLAVDVGLRTGLAVYGADGRLRSYRSTHFANRGVLRRGAFTIMRGDPYLRVLALEGGGELAGIWERLGQRLGLRVYTFSAEDWRRVVLYPRERRSGARAKEMADVLARRVIAWSGAPPPISLRHDVAEAILAGLWMALQLRWVGDLNEVLAGR